MLSLFSEFLYTSSASDDKHGAVSLGGSSDHVLDEVTMSGGVDDGDVVLGGFELPERDIDGDTTLTLGLEFVQHPGVLERALAHLKTQTVSQDLERFILIFPLMATNR